MYNKNYNSTLLTLKGAHDLSTRVLNFEFVLNGHYICSLVCILSLMVTATAMESGINSVKLLLFFIELNE
jgi:hypothetical protein